MRQNRREKNTKSDVSSLISNGNISKRFKAAIENITYRECAGRFNASAQAQEAGIKVTKDTVCRLANGDFVVVNKRIRALCSFYGVGIHENSVFVPLSEPEPESVSSERMIDGIDSELLKIAELAKRNPSLEAKLSKLIRGINEIVSSQGALHG